MAEFSYTLTKKQHDYLLPVFGLAVPGVTKLHARTEMKVDKFYFIGTHEEYLDALNRCRYLD